MLCIRVSMRFHVGDFALSDVGASLKSSFVILVPVDLLSLLKKGKNHLRSPLIS